jgi:hypothetical protein
MDPLAALGLAANIIQFVGFAASLISTSREVHSLATGTGRDITTLAIVHNQLEKLSRDLNFSDSGDKDSAELSQLAQTVRDLSQSCKLDCDSLLKAVQRLQTRNRGKWKSFKIALRTVWKASDIAALEKRLDGRRDTLNLAISTLLR